MDIIGCGGIGGGGLSKGAVGMIVINVVGGGHFKSIGWGHNVVFQVILGLGHMELYLLGIGSPFVGGSCSLQVILGLGHMGRGGYGLSIGVVYKVVLQELYLLGIGYP
ncbi:hypothetical protein ACTFIW_013291 [Dictyostelium discoideum]